MLASSPAFPHQAFRWGNRAYGVQFHLEVSLDMAEEWLQVPEYAQVAERRLGAGSAATLIDQFGKARGTAARAGTAAVRTRGWTFANCTPDLPPRMDSSLDIAFRRITYQGNSLIALSGCRPFMGRARADR